jgi:hypothetical protein
VQCATCGNQQDATCGDKQAGGDSFFFYRAPPLLS